MCRLTNTENFYVKRGGIMKKKNFIISISILFGIALNLNAQTWGPSKRLTWNSGLSSSPGIAVDSNNNIHVVWNDYPAGIA